MNDGGLVCLNSIALNVVQQLLNSRGGRRFVSEYSKTEGHWDHVSVKAVMLASMRSLVTKDWNGDFDGPGTGFGTTYSECFRTRLVCHRHVCGTEIVI